MERRQRPMNRSREEGIRFDFRLHFQASGLSKSQWDGLILSLVSVETGRIAAKTPRVLVRDGSCLWPDPIIETTKLAPDPLTGKYAEKLYKIVIQTGQVSVLGDATINLSDYIDAKSQISISLPLRNCNADTLLHVNVQCLTPRTGSRQKGGNNEQDYYGSVSEDNSSSSDVSENLSVGSSSSQKMSGRINGSHQIKRGSTGSSLTKDGHPKVDVIPALDASNGNVNSYLGSNGSRSFTAVSQKLEAAEITILKLREEASLNEQLVQKLIIEVGSLKQQLTSESKNVDDLKVEILAKNAECESLRSQLEQQKLSKAAPIDYYSRWGKEDSRSQVDTLHDEIDYLKQVNADLQLRLSKMNDSNEKFVALVQELEDSLNVKDAEVHKLEETNKDLLEKLAQHQDSQGDRRDADGHNLMHDASHCQQRLKAPETLIKDKEQKGIKLGRQLVENRLCMETQSSVEFGVNKVSNTGENDLSSNEMLQDLADNEVTNNRLEVLLAEANNKNDMLEERMQYLIDDSGRRLSKLEIEKGVLQKNLDESQSEARDAKEKYELLMQELESLKNTVDSLSDLKLKLEEGNIEHLNEISQLKEMIDDSRHSLLKLEIEKGDLQKNLDESQFETRAAMQKHELLMQELETLKKTVDSLSDLKIKLEEGNIELLHEISQLKAMIDDSGRRLSKLEIEKGDLQNKLDESQFEARTAKEKHEVRMQELETLKNTVDSLSDLKLKLEEGNIELLDGTLQLKEMNVGLSERVSNLDAHLTTVEKERDYYKQEIEIHQQNLKGELESRHFLLEKQLQEKTNECIQMQEMIEEQARQHQNGLDLKKRELDVEMQSLISQKESFERRTVIAEQALSLLQKEKNEEVNHLKEKLDLLQRQLEIQGDEKMEFLHKIETLEKEVQDKVDAFSIMEQKLTEVQGVAKGSMLQEQFKKLEDDSEAIQQKLITREIEFAQKEAELCRRIECLESTNEHLAAGTVDSGAEQLKHELLRLQNQNSFLTRKEQELAAALCTQKVLEEEVLRLQECNDLLEARLLKFMETAKNPFLLEKIVNLETELAEVVEASNMYKQQLRSVLDEQENGLLQIEHYKRVNTKLQEELNKIHERYTIVSLKLAETEAERSELQLRIRKSVNN